jgi:hypothetical protein
MRCRPRGELTTFARWCAGCRAIRVSPGSPDGSLIGSLASEAAIRVILADEKAMIEQYGIKTIAVGTI